MAWAGSRQGQVLGWGMGAEGRRAQNLLPVPSSGLSVPLAKSRFDPGLSSNYGKRLVIPYHAGLSL